ncbi:hypothetical protein GCM10011507_01350 [Edaphobacter acidisoli]|uniref:Uncharacterized protein n=1 Tax=Edaphobacter acidisoli TaxID=2040573 RepID=A0A916RHC9_9BACT|nr:hypothetical protein GCM10011507_01350 [Edaphobacter acidisoli]
MADRCYIIREATEQMRDALIRMDASAFHFYDGICDFTIHVQLQLLRSSVPEANGLRLAISMKPWKFAFWKVSFSVHPIHDLHATYIATHGLKKPLLPGARLVTITG